MKSSPFKKTLLSLLLLFFLSNPLHAYNVYDHPKYVFNAKSEAMNRRFLVELDASSTPESFMATVPIKYRDQIKVHKSFTHELFRGLSIEILDQEHAVLRSMLALSNIASVSPNRIVNRSRIPSNHAVHASNTTISREWVKKLLPHQFSQVDKVHQELNLTGEGIFIGVIDGGKDLYCFNFDQRIYILNIFCNTGIDYNLKALGKGFGPGFKVIAGYDLVGDDFNSSDPTSVPKPDNDPLDACSNSESGKKNPACRNANTEIF